MIKSVQVFSTGFGEQHTEHRYGSQLPRLWWVLTSRSWVKVPIYAYVVEHCDGLVLFDSGMDPAIGSDPNYVSSVIGKFLLQKIFRLHIGPEDSLETKLTELGFSVDDVCKVVISHLHFDHIGGIGDVPQAELLVSDDEWRQLSNPHPERNWILREHIELSGRKWHQIDFAPTEDALLAPFGGCYDVMGDGTMMLLPTPGHTVGSLSMLVRTGGMPPILLIGDLSYEVDMLMKDQVPGVCSDKGQLKSSFAKVRGLKEQLSDLVILASHDPTAAEALRLANNWNHQTHRQ